MPEKRVFAAFVCGLLFGIGLAVSRMVDPRKVLGFLDLGGIADGTWDPTLALVMVGALAVAGPAFWFANVRGRPFLAETLSVPSRRAIDRPLAVGAVMFGVGWGLVGFCPGPSVAALGIGGAKAWAFFAAMLGGMAVHEFWIRRHA